MDLTSQECLPSSARDNNVICLPNNESNDTNINICQSMGITLKWQKCFWTRLWSDRRGTVYHTRSEKSVKPEHMKTWPHRRDKGLSMSFYMCAIYGNIWVTFPTMKSVPCRGAE